MDSAAQIGEFLATVPDAALLAGFAGTALAILLLAFMAFRARGGQGLDRIEAQLALLAEERYRADARLAAGIDGSLDRAANAAQTGFAALAERLGRIDAAQARIVELSGRIADLDRTLNDKQARGAFGEARLSDLLRDALPADAFREQATLGNGRRADALVLLPQPPGPIAIDSKFPLERYRALLEAEDPADRTRAAAAFGRDAAKHVADIADRYIVPGETADCALMFVPSEAVYAEIHGRQRQVVEEGFRRRVYIVSPTTLWATLNTARAILKDARIRAESHALQQEALGLVQDVARLASRAEQAKRRLELAEADLNDLATAARSAERRGRRIAEFDLNS